MTSGSTVKVDIPNLSAPADKRILAVVFGGWAKAKDLHTAYCAARLNGYHPTLLWAAIVNQDDYINEDRNLVYDADNPPQFRKCDGNRVRVINREVLHHA